MPYGGDDLDIFIKKCDSYSEYIKLKSINKIFIHLGNIKVFFFLLDYAYNTGRPFTLVIMNFGFRLFFSQFYIVIFLIVVRIYATISVTRTSIELVPDSFTRWKGLCEQER